MKTLTKEEFPGHIDEIFKNALEICRKKNADYARASDDAFGGFRDLEIDNLLTKANLPFDSVILDLCQTIGHKKKRIFGLLLSTEAPNVDESLEDTLTDLINYHAILLCYIRLKEPR